MKKCLLLIALVLSVGAQTSFATVAGTNPIADSLLSKEVNRNTILQLELNEMQYIRLRELASEYQKETAITKEVQEKYSEELTTILTAKQISKFNQQLAASTKSKK